MIRVRLVDGPQEGRNWKWESEPPSYFTFAPFPYAGAKAFQAGQIYHLCDQDDEEARYSHVRERTAHKPL